MEFSHQAVQFKAYHGAEVIGAVYLGMRDNLRPEESQAILHKHQVTDVIADKWYPQQVSLDVARAIHESENGMEVLTAMGRGIGKTAVLPSEVDTFEKLMDVFPHLYQANVRGVPPEERFYVEKVSNSNYRFINNTPSSNFLVYGVVWEFVMRFKTPEQDIFVVPMSGMEPDATNGAVFEIER